MTVAIGLAAVVCVWVECLVVNQKAKGLRPVRCPSFGLCLMSSRVGDAAPIVKLGRVTAIARRRPVQLTYDDGKDWIASIRPQVCGTFAMAARPAVCCADAIPRCKERRRGVQFRSSMHRCLSWSPRASSSAYRAS